MFFFVFRHATCSLSALSATLYLPNTVAGIHDTAGTRGCPFLSRTRIETTDAFLPFFTRARGDRYGLVPQKERLKNVFQAHFRAGSLDGAWWSSPAEERRSRLTSLFCGCTRLAKGTPDSSAHRIYARPCAYSASKRVVWPALCRDPDPHNV